jgi:homoserine dehydrogenase
MFRTSKDMSNIKKAILIGYGTVGQGFYKALTARPIEGVELKAVVVKNKDKERDIAVQYDAMAAVESLNYDVIIEAIDDSEVAFTIAQKALINGKTVISASKKMLAKHLIELKELERTYSGTLLYEAAVAGGVPVLQTTDNYLANDTVHSVRGILNGTTNYILTQTFQKKINPTEALKQAQNAGFAESNPINDLNGSDARSKLILLVEKLWSIVLKEEDVLTFGIEHLNSDDVRYTREQNKEVRLIAQAIREGDEVFATVLPTWINLNDNLSAVRAEHNAIVFECECLGEIQLTGPGAGKGPTGKAIWNDLWQASQSNRYNQRRLHLQPLNTKGRKVAVYVRYSNEAIRSTLTFDKEKEVITNGEFKYLKGLIDVSELQKHKELLQLDKATVIVTGHSLEHH